MTLPTLVLTNGKAAERVSQICPLGIRADVQQAVQSNDFISPPHAAFCIGML